MIMDVARQPYMSIGQFGRAARLTIKALRLYDRKGILKPAFTDSESGYRYYARDQMSVANQIRELRQIEMSLEQIAGILQCPDRLMEEVEAHIRRFELRVTEIRKGARALLADVQQERETMDVRTKTVAGFTVISIKQNVKVDALVPFIGDALKRMQRHAEAEQASTTDVPFGIYHGPVNQDDDGPVEICLPIAERCASTDDLVVGEMPEAQIAYVDIYNDDCIFPAILGNTSVARRMPMWSGGALRTCGAPVVGSDSTGLG